MEMPKHRDQLGSCFLVFFFFIFFFFRVATRQKMDTDKISTGQFYPRRKEEDKHCVFRQLHGHIHRKSGIKICAQDFGPCLNTRRVPTLLGIRRGLACRVILFFFLCTLIIVIIINPSRWEKSIPVEKTHNVFIVVFIFPPKKRKNPIIWGRDWPSEWRVSRSFVWWWCNSSWENSLPFFIPPKLLLRRARHVIYFDYRLGHHTIIGIEFRQQSSSVAIATWKKDSLLEIQNEFIWNLHKSTEQVGLGCHSRCHPLVYHFSGDTVMDSLRNWKCKRRNQVLMNRPSLTCQPNTHRKRKSFHLFLKSNVVCVGNDRLVEGYQ